MKKLLTLIPALLMAALLTAHNLDVTALKLHEWKLNDNSSIQGSFLMMKDNNVYIEKNDGSVLHYPLTAFCDADKNYAQQRYAGIEQLNNDASAIYPRTATFNWAKFFIISAVLLFISLALYYFAGRRSLKYITWFLLVGVFATIYGFRKAAYNQAASTTSPGFIDSSFTPFKPNVVTSWDNDYFYVESKGIPTTHQMMVGISNHGWQQQVPIPQCYFLPNAWPIPLNPVLATSPIPVDSIHFTRGAIAIAANGIPIFNVHTNTGVDSYLDGQLDNYGGHCGRADDYHYHIAPLHLYSLLPTSLPCAFGLDGYAVYGSTEPDGSAMLPLDTNHGHFGGDGIYHYHGTSSAPYMIAYMAGEVTEDNTHQLIPQAAAHPIRPSRTPLSGALITACVPNANNNGYTLTYTRSGETYQVDYSWDAVGNYTFHYIGPSSTLDSLYHGFTQCELPSGINNLAANSGTLQLFPNPATNQFRLQLDNSLKETDVKSVSMISTTGTLVYYSNGFTDLVNTSQFSSGLYYVVVKTSKTSLVKKLLLQ